MKSKNWYFMYFKWIHLYMFLKFMNVNVKVNAIVPSETSISKWNDPNIKTSGILILPKKEIIGTRTTGAGSKRMDKSIFYQSFHKKNQKIKNNNNNNNNNNNRNNIKNTNNMRNELYIEQKDTELIFYFVNYHNNNNDTQTMEAVSLSHESMTNTNSSSYHKHDLQMKLHSSNRIKTWKTKDCIPIEGIYGIYMLPSGPHIVVIYESKNIYTSSNNNTNTTSNINGINYPLLDIHEINKMEIIPIPTKMKKSLTMIQK